jgi:hypothetical protein
MFASDVNQVVANMIERDSQRQATLNGYTALRRYTLDNKSRHASMLVRMTCQPDGSKLFDIVEEAGSGAVRKHVFHKILDEEAAASRPDLRDRSRVTPANYSFQIVGTEIVNGRATYAIDVTPKNESKYLIAGRIWVDAEDYAMVRVDGKPAKNPSFWTKSVHFIHNYEKSGSFWFPVSNTSVTDARIFGRTDLTIEYFGYVPTARVLSAAAMSRGQQ